MAKKKQVAKAASSQKQSAEGKCSACGTDIVEGVCNTCRATVEK